MDKKTVLLLLITLVLVSCGTRKVAVISTKEATSTQQAVLDYGMKYIGKPYRLAGKGPHAFDCSGFTSFVFREFGYKLGASSDDQDRQAPSVMQKKDLKIGDLVFFEGRFRNGKVGHVGIVKEVSSDGEFRFLHASTNNGVIISRSTEPYYASRYLRGGRIIRESDAPQTAKKNIPKASEAAHKNQKRNNAFVATQAKKQIGVEAPKTKTEMEIESTLAQTSELVTAKNDTLVVHSRPASMRLESQPGKQEEEKERLSIGDLAMTRPGTTSVPKPIETTIDGDNALVHEVAPGETLYSISRKYNCTVEQIRQWNSQIGRVLKSGDKLRIFH